MSFGGFSSFPRKPGIYGEHQPALGPVQDTVQGFIRTGTKAPEIVYAKTKVPVLTKLDPQIMWAGIIHGYSGYAKANREIMKRATKSVKIGLAKDSPWNEGEKNEENIRLHKTFSEQLIDQRAAQVTFLPPRSESRPGYRIIYTMMETEVVHQDMIHIMNAQYHECWVPTAWNANTFKKSGLTIPIKVMPLGIDPGVYSPYVMATMPKSLRLTGSTAGKYEIPNGFLFIYVCHPTFRKGIEVVIEAFAQAFSSDPGAGLIIASTAYSNSLFQPDASVAAKIWLLDAPLSERELAGVYRSCNVYVCASRGEGWNLPMMEAAAVGLPVIVPRTSAHSDLVPEDQGFFFSPDHTTVFPSAKDVSQWFDGIPFPDFGDKSIEELIRVLRMVKQGYRSAKEVGLRYMNTVKTKYTWDLAAAGVAKRIKELCSGS